MAYSGCVGDGTKSGGGGWGSGGSGCDSNGDVGVKIVVTLEICDGEGHLFMAFAAMIWRWWSVKDCDACRGVSDGGLGGDGEKGMVVMTTCLVI